jgi:Activator of Hsp90 ATPase homolog 1-like protein
MSDQSYTTSFSVHRTPDEVFDAITNARGWWSEEIEGDADRVGEEFTFRVKDIHYSKIRVTELVPGQKLVWRVLDNYMNFIDDQSEWKDTEIRFELSPQDGTTEVRFTHAGLVPQYECFDVCSNAWGFYIGDSLRSLITMGEGKPSSNPDEARFGKEERVG